MSWSLWTRQMFTIAKIELKRYILARRWLGIYLVVCAPVALLLLQVLIGRETTRPIEQFSGGYAFFFQLFMLRLAIFFSCMAVFSQMFRGEILEKTLHFYLLSPVRREVIAAGKYMAGVVAMGTLFGLCTIATNFLNYMPHSGYGAFFLEGNGLWQMWRYVLVAVLACATYGGIFLVVGLRFKNPVIPAIALLGWEAFYFVLPETLQKITVVHYLQSMLPVKIALGPFALVADATPAIVGIPVLLAAAGLFVWLSGRMLRSAEVTYGAD